MQAVILAAGAGTRLGPLTDSAPKPMLPVGDRPLVAHVADAAVEAGATEMVVVVGYRSDRVREYFADTHRGVPVRLVDQGEPTGTADAVLAAREHLDGDFAVLNGDNLYDPEDLSRLFERAPSVGVCPTDEPESYGIVAVEDGTVTGVTEKPSDPDGNLANTGACVLPGAATDELRVPLTDRGERELTDVVDTLAGRLSVAPVRFGEWLDVATPPDLLAANELVLGRLDGRVEGTVHPDATLRGDVLVADGATVDAGVVVDGPVVVGPGAEVGPNAYVRGPTVVGSGAVVGHAVEVKASVVGPRSHVAHLSYVGDSLLGEDVNLGAGTNVANLRHDGDTVRLTVKGDRVSTGRRKFGAVVGPRTKTGIDTSIAPGVTLGAGARTAPGETVLRDRSGSDADGADA
jgi:bifunctional UDP-N-acetylglucosamine pyrophosphorylase/glucosamine-1-phosphate N-acetyltransferase